MDASLLACGVLGTLGYIFKLILLFIGHDWDSEFDFQTNTESDSSIKLFSLNVFFAFLMGYGWGALSFKSFGFSYYAVWGIIPAIILVLMALGIAFIIKRLRHTVTPSAYVPKVGDYGLAYTPISTTSGEVIVSMRHFQAVSRTPIASFEGIRVCAVMGDHLVGVCRICDFNQELAER